MLEADRISLLVKLEEQQQHRAAQQDVLANAAAAQQAIQAAQAKLASLQPAAVVRLVTQCDQFQQKLDSVGSAVSAGQYEEVVRLCNNITLSAVSTCPQEQITTRCIAVCCIVIRS